MAPAHILVFLSQKPSTKIHVGVGGVVGGAGPSELRWHVVVEASACSGLHCDVMGKLRRFSRFSVLWQTQLKMNKEHQYTFRRSLAHVMKAEFTLPPETSPEKAATNAERATIDEIFRNGLTWASTWKDVCSK